MTERDFKRNAENVNKCINIHSRLKNIAVILQACSQAKGKLTEMESGHPENSLSQSCSDCKCRYHSHQSNWHHKLPN